MAAKRPSHARALACTLGGYFIIATGPLFVRMSDTGPLSSAFWRMGLATIVMALVAMLPTRSKSLPGRADSLLIMLAGAAFAVDLGLMHIAIVRIRVADAALLANLSPVFAGVITMMFGRRFPALYWAGVAVTIVGAAAVSGGSLTLVDADALGTSAAIGSALFFAFYLLMVEDLRSRHGLLSILLLGGLGAMITLLPAALLMEPAFTPQSLEGWLALTALGLIVQCGGQGLVVYGLARLSGTESGLAGLTVPVIAGMFGALLLSEPMEIFTWAGGLAVLGGLAIAIFATSKPLSDPFDGKEAS